MPHQKWSLFFKTVDTVYCISEKQCIFEFKRNKEYVALLLKVLPNEDGSEQYKSLFLKNQSILEAIRLIQC